MKGEPLKFFRVRIEVYPAIAPVKDYCSADWITHDFDKAEITDKPVITHIEDVTDLDDDRYLAKLINERMHRIGADYLYTLCPDPRLLEEQQ